METVRIDEERCTLCGTCYPVCVRRIIEEGAEAAYITDESLCILCGHCKAVCPENAPQFPSLDAEEFEPVPKELPGPDQLMALFRSRRSTRIFKNSPLEKERLERIIEAGRFAPTGGNRQALRHVVVLTPQKLTAVRQMAIEALLDQAQNIELAIQRQKESGKPLPQKYQTREAYVNIWRNLSQLNRQGVDRLFFHAPALVVCHFNPLEAVTPEADPGLVAMQMVLMAHALGLGTCFIGFLVFALEESKTLRETLGIPEGHRVPYAFVVGDPDVSFLRLVSRNPAAVNWL